MSNLTFAYFNFQGRGQVVRLLLAYTKLPYNQTLYSFQRISDWLEEDKKNLNLPFPSLPYLIDGQFKLTQSKAVERYIILKSNRTQLLGRNARESALIDNFLGIISDIFQQLVILVRSDNLFQIRKEIYDKIKAKLSLLQSHLKGHKFCLSRLSYADFNLSVLKNYLDCLFPHQIKEFQNINKVCSNFENLQEIKQYYSSSKAIKALLFGTKAKDPRYQNLAPLDLKQEQKTKPQIIKEDSPTKVLEQQKQTPADIKKVQQQQEPWQRLVQNQPEVQKKQSRNNPGSSKPIQSKLQQYLQAANKANTQQHVPKIEPPAISRVTPSQIRTEGKNASWVKQQQSQSIIPEKEQNLSHQGLLTLGYWGIRGLGQVQRHLLSYCVVPFRQKIYKTQQQWFNGDKLNLGITFPNLPYLIAKEIKITESIAIDRYIIGLSGKSQLLGQNLKDEAYVMNTHKILSDLFKQIRVLCFTENQQQNKKLQEKVRQVFERISNFIGEKQFVFGYLTLVDFYIAQISFYVEKIYPELWQKFNYLQRIRNNFQGLDNVKNYYSRDIAIKGPFMPPSAKIAF